MAQWFLQLRFPPDPKTADAHYQDLHGRVEQLVQPPLRLLKNRRGGGMISGPDDACLRLSQEIEKRNLGTMVPNARVTACARQPI